MANGILYSGSMLRHVRGKLRDGKPLDRREYRVALAHMLYVPDELRPARNQEA